LCSFAQLLGMAQTIPLNLVVERGVAKRWPKVAGGSTWCAGTYHSRQVLFQGC
jgi:hypothetical protein